MDKILFQPMSELEHNGPGFYYALTVKARGSAATEVDNYKIDNWRNYTKEIAVQNKAYTPYIVTVQAKNNEGDAKEDAPEYTLYSFEDSKCYYTPDIGSFRFSVRPYVRSFVRSSFRHRVKVFSLKFIRPHILKTL